MARDLRAYYDYQVFLNYPYDAEFRSYSEALSFAVIASGLIPVAAVDLTLPDRPRLQTLVQAISACRFSVHDLSRSAGEGEGEGNPRTDEHAAGDGYGALLRPTDAAS